MMYILLIGILINYCFVLYLIRNGDLHFKEIDFIDGICVFSFLMIPYLFTILYINFNRVITMEKIRERRHRHMVTRSNRRTKRKRK